MYIYIYIVKNPEEHFKLAADNCGPLTAEEEAQLYELVKGFVKGLIPETFHNMIPF